MMRFADLTAGQRFVSTGRTLTEAELAFFCMLTGDWHPIHADAEAAREMPMGRRLFHGTFGIAVTVALATRLPELVEPVIAATGLREWKFDSPLFIGDTVHAEVELLAATVTSNGRRGVVERRLSLVKHDGTIIQQGESGLMVALRPDSLERTS